jgi:ubiquinone/menaquinone biosynthesis C-methylase UbiE
MTNLDYTSADLDSPLAMLKVDIMAIPFPDHSFDVVLCNHVLEHVPDDRKAIGELLRVLKPGGWAILQSPVNTTCEKTFEYAGAVTAEVRKTLSGASDHLRIYGLDYRERLESAGFQVKVDGYVRELSPEVVGMCALDREEDIYYCTKPAG